MNIDRAHSFEHLLRLNRATNHAFFLREFSHEFNNPLNSIQMAGELLKGYTQDINALLEELNDEPERLPAGFQEECCRILANMPILTAGISDSVTKLKHFTSWLSEFTGRATITGIYGMDLNWLISHCASMAHHQISVYTNIFRLDLEPDVPVLHGNAEQMLQVILNLLMNALISLPDRSCAVVLSTSYNCVTDCVQMLVQDEGGGIPADILPDIFKPFFSTWAEYGCMGLGLTVADQIIRNRSGKMSIDSALDKGTRVTVSLPVQNNGV